MTLNQFKNLLAFLCLAGGEDPSVFLDKAPPFLIEKYSRYATVATLRDDDAWRWGLHPILRRAAFDPYCAKWGLSEDADDPTRHLWNPEDIGVDH